MSKFDFPWEVGDLVVYHEDITKAFTENSGKSAVILEFTESPLVQINILVDGHIKTVLPTHLSTPKVKKIKTSFGLKR